MKNFSGDTHDIRIAVADIGGTCIKSGIWEKGEIHKIRETPTQARLGGARRELDRLKNSRVLRNIKAPIQDRRLAVDGLRRRMALALRGRAEGSRQVLNAQKGRLPLALTAQTAKKKAQLGRLAAGLDALSPLKVLGRGYAIARKGEDVVSSVAQAQPGDRLEVLVSDGALRCEVKEKEERTWR